MQRIIWSSLLTSLTLAAVATAQVAQPPVGAGVGAGAAAGANVVSAPATVAPAKNLWSCILLSPEQRANCQSAWCRSPLGQLASGAMAPISGLSGGLIQNHCIERAIKDVLEDPKKVGSAEGAAAQIKQDEAEMQARREAVRYLGTVDCSRWPTAAKALADSLLKDRSECVRFEAALALQKGCCCNKLIVEALTACITDKGEVVEKSERVKNAAIVALSRCVLPPEPLPTPKTDEIPPVKKVVATEEVSPADYILQARKALAQTQGGGTNGGATTTVASVTRPGTVTQIFSNALSAPTSLGGNAISPTDPALGADRKPFFDTLTKSLKGPQTAARPIAVAVADVPVAPVPVMVTVDAPLASPVTPQTVVVTLESAPMQLPGAGPVEPRPLPFTPFQTGSTTVPTYMPVLPTSPRRP